MPGDTLNGQHIRMGRRVSSRYVDARHTKYLYALLPALLIHRSMPPNCCTANLPSCATSAGFATFAAMPLTVPPPPFRFTSACNPLTASDTRASEREHTQTLSPASKNADARARPTPATPPQRWPPIITASVKGCRQSTWASPYYQQYCGHSVWVPAAGNQQQLVCSIYVRLNSLPNSSSGAMRMQYHQHQGRASLGCPALLSAMHTGCATRD